MLKSIQVTIPNTKPNCYVYCHHASPFKKVTPLETLIYLKLTCILFSSKAYISLKILRREKKKKQTKTPKKSSCWHLTFKDKHVEDWGLSIFVVFQ